MGFETFGMDCVYAPLAQIMKLSLWGLKLNDLGRLDNDPLYHEVVPMGFETAYTHLVTLTGGIMKLSL